MNDEQLTVKELIELLKKCPPDCIVYTEGCDCFGKADGVKYDEGDKDILITRL
jgi:hypothetical protein